MSNKEFISEIEGLDVKALYEKATETQEELLKLKLRHAGGQLETPHRIPQLKRNYARILTKIQQQKSAEKAA